MSLPSIHHSYPFSCSLPLSVLPLISLSLLFLSNPCVVPSLLSPLPPCLISPSLPHSLPPSVSLFIATTLPLPSYVSFTASLLFSTLTLSPHPLAHCLPPPPPSLSGVTGRSLWLSHGPPVPLLLTAPFTCHFFFFLFCEWRPSERRRRGVLLESRGVASGEQHSSVVPEMCHYGNLC